MCLQQDISEQSGKLIWVLQKRTGALGNRQMQSNLSQDAGLLTEVWLLLSGWTPDPPVGELTSVHCCHSWQFFCSWSDLLFPGVQQDQSEVLTDSAGLIQPIFLPWEAKERRFLMCSPIVQILCWTGAWKLLCHLWFRNNFIGKPCHPQELPCLWMLSEWLQHQVIHKTSLLQRQRKRWPLTRV